MKKKILIFFLLFMIQGAPIVMAKEELWNHVEKIEQAYEDAGGDETAFSVQEYIKNIMEGTSVFSVKELWKSICGQMITQWEKQKNTVVTFFLVGIISGLCANFSGTIGEDSDGQISFYLIYGFLSAALLTAFYEVYDVAKEAVDQLFTFLQALIPSFSLALGMGGSTGTALGFYEVMIVAMMVLEWLMKYILLPLVEMYFALCLLNPLSQNRFTKMAALCERGSKWLLRIFMMAILGYQGIQGLLLPVMDKVRNNSVLHAAKGIPGIGNTIGGAADTLVGSGVLIKSAVGVGGLICLVSLIIVPLIKIGIFALLYQVVAAFVQPVSDHRVSKILWTTANCGKLLFHCLFIGALVFFLSVVIILSATNLI